MTDRVEELPDISNELRVVLQAIEFLLFENKADIKSWSLTQSTAWPCNGDPLNGLVLNFLANKNRLPGAVFKYLRDNHRHKLPALVTKNLDTSHQYSIRSQLHYAGLLQRVKRACDNDVLFWVGGGFLVSTALIAEPGMLRFERMELLVKPDSSAAIAQQLTKLGFLKTGNEFLTKDSGLRVSLRTIDQLFNLQAQVFLKGDWYQYTEQYSICGGVYSAPCVELLFLIIAVDCDSLGWRRLISLVDLALCLKHPKFSMERATNISSQLNITSIFWLAISVLNTLFKKLPAKPVNVPDKLIPTVEQRTLAVISQVLSLADRKPDMTKRAKRQSSTFPAFATLASRPTFWGEYIATPIHLVGKILELAQISSSDVVYDLGCGDGRLLVQAALRYGCRCVGIECDPMRVQEANIFAAENKVKDLVSIRLQDVMQADIADATVVFSYLNNNGNRQLLPVLQKNLSKTARIVTHQFWFEGLSLEHVETIETGFAHVSDIYIWKLP